MSKSFKIAMAQINPLIGDFEGNFRKHIEFIERAQKQGARLVIFPELSLVGYIPRDLLLEPHFLSHQNVYLHKLQEAIGDIYVLIGAVTKNPSGIEKPFFNSALCFHKKKQVFQYDKKLLPTYDVFDERRYFERGTREGHLVIEGHQIALSICEDMWQHAHYDPQHSYNLDPIKEFHKPLDLLVNMSGSPYYQDKLSIRSGLIQPLTQEFGCPMAYVNLVGAHDAIIFDGYSIFADKRGELIYAQGFNEDLKVIDLYQSIPIHASSDFSLDLEKALILGIKDYLYKNGHSHVIVGLSGGIDSALVLALCTEALGPDSVKAIYMPSQHSRPLSQELASKIALNFKVSLDVVPIDSLVAAYEATLKRPLALQGEALENIQARIRGTILMAYANTHKALVMGCSNKSELAVGYGSLYGDIIGALLPIGDLFKGDVYRLARQISRGRLPEAVFTRAPSAELSPDQEDSDHLPPYEILDLICKLTIEKNRSKEEILALHPECAPFVDKVLTLFKAAEFKRYQAPPILKVTVRNFGTGWDAPLTRGYIPS